MNASQFARGSAVYKCRCCERSTRATGRGDNDHVRLCAECYDLAGEENHLSDTGEFYCQPSEILGLISFLESKGANVSCWNDMKAKAEQLVAA